jgi:CBS domain-containing protein
MLPLPAPDAPGPVIAIGSVVIGLVCGAVGVGMTEALHRIESLYERLPIPRFWWPALGGLAVGVIGWIDPRTLGAGYFNLRALLDGDMMMTAIASLALLKFLSWALYLGSGTAGGTLAPVMTVGGACAALVAHGLGVFPQFADFPIGVAALVGMAAVFAGMSRAFLASVAFAFEATHSTSAFGPLLLGCAFAVLVSRLLKKESIMTEKLSRLGVKVPEDYEPDLLATTSVAVAMNRSPQTIPPELPLAELYAKANDDSGNPVRFFPVIDDDRILFGVITRADLLEAARSLPEARAEDLANRHPFIIHPDETLADAADRMVLHEVGRLPVVARGEKPILLGLITRKEILNARRQRLLAENGVASPHSALSEMTANAL